MLTNKLNINEIKNELFQEEIVSINSGNNISDSQQITGSDCVYKIKTSFILSQIKKLGLNNNAINSLWEISDRLLCSVVSKNGDIIFVLNKKLKKKVNSLTNKNQNRK